MSAIMAVLLRRPAMTIRVRTLSLEEQGELARMARYRTLCAGRVKRAQLVLLAVEGQTAAAIAESLRLQPGRPGSGSSASTPTASPGSRRASGRAGRRPTRRSRSHGGARDRLLER